MCIAISHLAAACIKCKLKNNVVIVDHFLSYLSKTCLIERNCFLCYRYTLAVIRESDRSPLRNRCIAVCVYSYAYNSKSCAIIRRVLDLESADIGRNIYKSSNAADNFSCFRIKTVVLVKNKRAAAWRRNLYLNFACA